MNNPKAFPFLAASKLKPVSIAFDCGLTKHGQEVRCEYDRGELVITKIQADQRDETQVIRGLTIENLRMFGLVADALKEAGKS